MTSSNRQSPFFSNKIQNLNLKMFWKNLSIIPQAVVLVLVLFSAMPCSAQFIPPPAESPIIKAMRMEMKRSIEELRLKNAEKPYFIQYTIRDQNSWDAEATFGTIVDTQITMKRTLDVDVRVGNREFDNTGFVSMNDIFFGDDAGGDIVMGDDVDAIRHEIWRATDAAYKEAVEKFAQKQAHFANVVQQEKIPDFSEIILRAHPDNDDASYLHSSMPQLDDTVGLAQLIRQGSAVFRKYPAIQESRVHVQLKRITTHVVTSDSVIHSIPRQLATIEVFARAQGADGMPVHRYLPLYSSAGGWMQFAWPLDPSKNIEHSIIESFDSHRPFDFQRDFDFQRKEFKYPQDLEKEIQRFAEELTALAAAPVLEKNYDGPVLFTGQASAEIMAQVLAPHLSGHRPPVADNSPAASIAGGTSSELAGKINRRVLPRFLSVYDDPLALAFGGRPLVGSYIIDDQGVPAEKVTLVENGVLKNLLMTRRPTTHQPGSNGHARLLGPNNFSATISNLVVEASEGRSEAELKKELIKLCRDLELPYGILIRNVMIPGTVPNNDMSVIIFGADGGGSGGARSDLSAPVMAYKVYVEDGREELVRGLSIGEFSVRSLRYIAAAGNTPYVHDRTVRCQGIFCREDVPVSIVAPSLLFEELEIARTGGSQKKPALLSHPFFD